MDSSAIKNKQRVSDARPEFIVLGLLRAGSTHGYDLYRQFERHLGRVWHISQSQLYATLKRLETRSLIAGTSICDSGSLGRRSFSLTKAGESHFDAWLTAACVSSTRIIRLEFVTRLFFAEFLGKPNPSVLVDAQMAVVAEELHRLERNGEAPHAGSEGESKFNRLGESFRLNQMRSMLSWLQNEVARMFHGK